MSTYADSIVFWAKSVSQIFFLLKHFANVSMVKITLHQKKDNREGFLLL